MTQNRLFKALLIGVVCSFIQISAMDDVVTLQSNDGEDFQVEVATAKRSETLKDLIKDTGIDKSLPLPNISGKTLQHLVPLMKKVHEMQVENERAESGEQIYIPRAYQSFVNILLKDMPIVEVVELYNAADCLGSRFILNAVAAVIADRIPEDMRDDAIEFFFDELRDDKIDKLVGDLKKRIGLDVFTINKDIWSYIGKHLQFRICGVKEEYSIADYIKEHGKPSVESNGFTYLTEKGLTSLFGVRLLSEPSEALGLMVAGNCFVDFSLDVQVVYPQLFTGMNIFRLELSGNSLRTLSLGFIRGIPFVASLGLEDNQLKTLPEGITVLKELLWVTLRDNKFDEAQKSQIKNSLKHIILDS